MKLFPVNVWDFRFISAIVKYLEELHSALQTSVFMIKITN